MEPENTPICRGKSSEPNIIFRFDVNLGVDFWYLWCLGWVCIKCINSANVRTNQSSRRPVKTMPVEVEPTDSQGICLGIAQPLSMRVN